MTGVVMTIVRSRGPGLLPLGLLPLHVAEDEPLLLNKFDFLQKNIYIEYASQVQSPIKNEQMKETSRNVLTMTMLSPGLSAYLCEILSRGGHIRLTPAQTREVLGAAPPLRPPDPGVELRLTQAGVSGLTWWRLASEAIARGARLSRSHDLLLLVIIRGSQNFS